MSNKIGNIAAPCVKAPCVNGLTQEPRRANSGFLLTISSAGLAAETFSKLTDLWGEIVRENNEQQQNSIRAQVAQAKGASELARAAAIAGGIAAFVAASITIAGTLGSKSLGGGSRDTAGQAKVTNLQTKLTALGEKKDTITNWQNTLGETAANAGAGQVDDVVQAPVAQARADILAGEYDTLDLNSPEVGSALGLIKATPDEYRQMKANLKGERRDTVKASMANVEEQGNVLKGWSRTGDFAKGLSDSASTMVNGGGRIVEGDRNAESRKMDGTSQLAARTGANQAQKGEAAAQQVQKQSEAILGMLRAERS